MPFFFWTGSSDLPYFANMSPARESAVAGECPDQPGGGRYEGNVPDSDDEDDEDYHAVGSAAGGIGQEDIHERHTELSGWTL